MDNVSSLRFLKIKQIKKPKPTLRETDINYSSFLASYRWFLSLKM